MNKVQDLLDKHPYIFSQLAAADTQTIKYNIPIEEPVWNAPLAYTWEPMKYETVTISVGDLATYILRQQSKQQSQYHQREWALQYPSNPHITSIRKRLDLDCE